MAQRSSNKATVRRFVFSAFDRQRVVTVTKSGKSVIIQRGVRFGNMNPPVEKKSPTEESAELEADNAIENLIDEGFQELSEDAYKTFVHRLCFSCADDDLRRYPIADHAQACDLSDKDIRADQNIRNASGGGTGDGGLIPLGQAAAEAVLANPEIKDCKTLELILPPSDLVYVIKLLSQSKSSLGVEALVLKAVGQADRNGPEEQENKEDKDCEYDEYEEGWTSLPCDCFADAFPKIKRLSLIGGVWQLEGEQCQSLEEIDAWQMLTPSIRFNNLKRLKYMCTEFDPPIESDCDFKPISPAVQLAVCCPKLESLDIDIMGGVDMLEDILTSRLCERLTSLKIGLFRNCDMEKIFLLFTRFTDRLLYIKDLTLTMEYDSVDKTYIDRLKAFCIPLKLEYL